MEQNSCQQSYHCAAMLLRLNILQEEWESERLFSSRVYHTRCIICSLPMLLHPFLPHTRTVSTQFDYRIRTVKPIQLNCNLTSFRTPSHADQPTDRAQTNGSSQASALNYVCCLDAANVTTLWWCGHCYQPTVVEVRSKFVHLKSMAMWFEAQWEVSPKPNRSRPLRMSCSGTTDRAKFRTDWREVVRKFSFGINFPKAKLPFLTVSVGQSSATTGEPQYPWPL